MPAQFSKSKWGTRNFNNNEEPGNSLFNVYDTGGFTLDYLRDIFTGIKRVDPDDIARRFPAFYVYNKEKFRGGCHGSACNAYKQKLQRLQGGPDALGMGHGGRGEEILLHSKLLLGPLMAMLAELLGGVSILCVAKNANIPSGELWRCYSSSKL